MKKYSIVLSLLLLIFSCFAVRMDEQLVKPDSLNIGTPINMKLSFSEPVDSVNIAIPDTSSVLDFNATEIIEDKDGVTGANIYFAPFETGQVILPAFEVESWQNEIPEIHNTRQYTLLVQSVLPDSGAVLRDIDGPVKVNLTVFDYLLIIVVIAAIVLIIWLLTKIPKKEYKKVVREKPIIVIPAWETALSALKELKDSDLLKNGNFLEYYFELSLILRKLIEGFYNFNAAEMTTYEINEALAELKVEERLEIKAYLQSCDMIKYAKQMPSMEDADKAYSWLYQYAEQIKKIDLERKAALEKEKQNA